MTSIIAPFTSASDRGYKFLRVFDQYYVSRGGRAVLRVSGGIAPYNWVVTGSDFTLDAAQTAIQYNFINVANNATQDNTETVTVTDANSETVTITVCTCNVTDFPGPGTCDTTLDSCSVAPVVLLMQCTSATITAVGGCPPYHWEITTSTGDVELAAEYTNSPVNKVRCIDANCYTTGCEFTVTVTDANSDVVVCGLGCDANVMTLDDGATDDTVDFATPATVTITGGFGPYLWEISGLGHSISPSGSSSSQVATVSTIQGTCGNQVSPYCTVTITDVCGTIVTHIIRNLEAVGAGWGGATQVAARCGGCAGGNNCWSYACPCYGADCAVCGALYPYGATLYQAQYKFSGWTNACTCNAAATWCYWSGGAYIAPPSYMIHGSYPSPEIGRDGTGCVLPETQRCIVSGYYVYPWVCI